MTGQQATLPPYVTAKRLRWTCLHCNQQWDMDMPGFPGSNISGMHKHYIDGNVDRPCGPIIAVMLGTQA